MKNRRMKVIKFFFNETANTEINTYLHTLSRHDALPISSSQRRRWSMVALASDVNVFVIVCTVTGASPPTGTLPIMIRSEEHTSELQSLIRISYAVFCLK